MTVLDKAIQNERVICSILWNIFDRLYVIDPVSRQCTEYASGNVVLQIWSYDEWLISLARDMYKLDIIHFLPQMDVNALLERLRKGEKCLPVGFRRVEKGILREYQFIPTLSDNKERLFFLRQELSADQPSLLTMTEELRHNKERLHFLIGHLLENYIEINVKTGKCTMFPASPEKMQPKQTLKEQIAWWAEHIIVPEEREAYIREYDLERLVRTLRAQDGYHRAIYTADFGGTKQSLSIVSILFKETWGEGNEYIFAYAQDITLLKEQERRNKQLVDISHQLLSISQTEAVTGLYNRAAGEKMILEQLQSRKTGPVGTMLLLDIDYFKQVNDQYGHQTGDFVLKFFAQTLQDVFRSADILCRWGGDEFIVFMPDICDKKNVESRIERLRVRMRQCGKTTKPLVVTLSIGGVLALPGMPLDTLFNLCDKALYHVKKQGRDGFLLDFAEAFPIAASLV